VAKYIFKGTSSTISNEESAYDDMEMEIINDVLVESDDEAPIDHSIEVINAYNDDVDSLNNEDKTEINDETTLTTASTTQVRKNEIDREIQNLYTEKERNEIVNKLFNKIINYLEDKEEKQKDNNKTQEFAKLMFEENTKLQKELTKLRSELSAERVLRETAEEELARYRTLMQSTLLNGN
jgi:hypothetical protein